jgi:TonB family protein
MSGEDRKTTGLVPLPSSALALAGRNSLARRGRQDLLAAEEARVAHPVIQSNLEVLSDTMGVDFCPYLRQVIQATQSCWHILIPPPARPPLLKKGKVSIQFTIAPDGSVKQMQLIGPSGDISLDRAAWGGITGAEPFSPLPEKFKGAGLTLRFHFLYNESQSTSDGQAVPKPVDTIGDEPSPTPSNLEPTNPSARIYPKLSPEQQRESLTEWKRLDTPTQPNPSNTPN